MAADARGRLWNSLRGLLPAGCHATRIENSIGSGFPDVHYTYLETTGTIELKSADRLPMKKAGLRKSQIDWIKEEVEAGGLVWILVEYKDKVYIINGMYAELVNHKTEEDMPFISMALWTKSISHSEKTEILESILLNKA